MKITNKRCKQCKKSKPCSEFNNCSARKDNLYHLCRSCQRKKQRAYRESRKVLCPKCKENKINPGSPQCMFCRSRASRAPYKLKKGKGFTAQGYVWVKDRTHPNRSKNNLMLEHRLVMEKHLGRYLTKEENVHHINGVRHDNRLENLELWSSGQPGGQRISDKIIWAKEILEKYGTDESKW